GVAQGVAESARVAPRDPGALAYPYYYRPWGFGFGFLGFLFPIFFFFLIFGLLRAALWGPRWGWGGDRGGWGRGVPPPLEEWHRRRHESGGETRIQEPPTEQT